MTARTSASGYIYGIDLIRFLAALSVAIFHLSWLIQSINWLMPFGWVGVEVFFVISGLVIANSADGATPKSFAIGRFLRLYPAAWCAALLNGTIIFLLTAASFQQLGIHVWQTPWAFLRSLVLLGNNNFLASAYWTLPIELTFYSLIWLMIYFRQFAKIQILAMGLIAWSSTYIGLIALHMIGLIHYQVFELGYGWKTCSLLRHGVFFGLGILVWLFKEKRLRKLGWLVLFGGLVMAVVEICYRAAEITLVMERNSAYRHTGVMMIECCVAFLIAFCAIILSVRFNESFPANARFRRVVRMSGLTTYPFYLLHEALGGLVLFEMHRMGFSYLSGIPIALICIAVASICVADYGEPSIRRLLKQRITLLKQNA